MKNATRRLVVIGVALTGVLASVASSSLAAQTTEDKAPSARIARLEKWLSTVAAHVPGAIDDEALEINRWSSQELRQIWIDVMSVVSLVRQPDVTLFYIVEPAPGRSQSPSAAVQLSQRRSTQVLYTVGEVRTLRRIAQRVSDQGAGAESDVLRRGAMLHADIAMLVPSEGPGSRGIDPGPQGFTVHMNDGRQTGFEQGASHWDMGRRLLDRVRPPEKGPGDKSASDPGRDPVVRLWYLTSATYLQSLMVLDTSHVARALDLFPRDPDILFLVGAHHETAAGPRIQGALRTLKVPSGITFAVQGEGAELRQAEQFYRRALESNPELIEARIRLGHVLEKRGRHQEALEQLRGLSSKAVEPELQYYAALFEGAAAESLGNEDQARQSYQRARSLFPKAQSPLLALSRLAGPSGDVASARDAIGQVLKLPADDEERIDPWWTYDISQGRNVDALLVDLRSRF